MFLIISTRTSKEFLELAMIHPLYHHHYDAAEGGEDHTVSWAGLVAPGVSWPWGCIHSLSHMLPQHCWVSPVQLLHQHPQVGRGKCEQQNPAGTTLLAVQNLPKVRSHLVWWLRIRAVICFRLWVSAGSRSEACCGVTEPCQAIYFPLCEIIRRIPNYTNLIKGCM